MQVKYPLDQASLDRAVGQFSRRVAERDPQAKVELRWGFMPNEVLIVVVSPNGGDGYSLNYVTGEWYRYVS